MTTIYTVNNKVLKNVANDKWLIKKEPMPPIPDNTVRVRTIDGNVPVKDSQSTYVTATLVSGTTNVYDVYKSGSDFRNLLHGATNIVEVLGANIPSVTRLTGAFDSCSSLSQVALFDTSNVTTMASMFYRCSSLTAVPLFDTSKVTNVYNTFNGCTNVESGALALYQQMSTQTNPPKNHSGCFNICGSKTVTGAAELAQIPSSWGGTGS